MNKDEETMRQMPDGTTITLSYNMLGQLCAWWHFKYEGHPFAACHVGITDGLDKVLDEIKEVYRAAKENYG